MAAVISPIETARMLPVGSVVPRNIVAMNCPPMIHRPKCRNGRLR